MSTATQDTAGTASTATEAKKPPARRGAGRAATGTEPTKLVIRPIQTEILQIQIWGTAPLIVSRFSEKAKQQMLAAQQGVKRQPEKRDPEKEYLASLYRAGVVPDTDIVRFGLPAMAFKMATIGAGRYYGKQVKMTELRQFMFFYGVQVPEEAGRMVILDGKPRMREDYVRLAGVNHPADLRYRGCFDRWRATLYVSYTKNLLDRDSVVSLIEAGGLGVGVGEWRPERNGEFGTFRIADGRGAVSVVKALPALYSPDQGAYNPYATDAEDEGDGDVLRLGDFDILTQAAEVLEEDPKTAANGESGPGDGKLKGEVVAGQVADAEQAAEGEPGDAAS